MLDFNRNAQLDFISWIAQGALQIHPITNNNLTRIFELSQKYQDLPMDFANACLVLLAEKQKITKIATIDKDFGIYRINGELPFDLVIKPS